MSAEPLLRSLPAMRGWQWLIEGFRLFLRAPLIWIIFTLILFVTVELAARAPALGALLLLFYPLFLAGLMLACADLEQGRTLDFVRLSAALRRNPARLTTIGGVYLVGQLLIMWAMVLIGGEQMDLLAAGQVEQADPEALVAAFGAIMSALLAGMALSIPLLMAVWFSPLLVVFEDLPAMAAIRLSIRACWVNTLPFLVFGLIAIGIIIVAILPFGMANPQFNPGIWIATPFLLPSIYASYRDIFAQRDAPTGEDAGTP